MKSKADKFYHWNDFDNTYFSLFQSIKKKKKSVLYIVNITYLIISGIAAYFLINVDNIQQYMFILLFMFIVFIFLNLFLKYIYKPMNKELEEYVRKGIEENG